MIELALTIVAGCIIGYAILVVLGVVFWIKEQMDITLADVVSALMLVAVYAALFYFIGQMN